MSHSLESLIRRQISAEQSPAIGADFIAYVLVGAVAILAYVCLSEIAHNLLPAAPSWAVGGVCYAALVIAAYLAHWRIAFHTAVRQSRAFLIYFAVQTMSIGLATLFSFVAYGVIGLPDIPAAVTVLLLTSGVNFFVLRVLAFDRRQGTRGTSEDA